MALPNLVTKKHRKTKQNEEPQEDLPIKILLFHLRAVFLSTTFLNPTLFAVIIPDTNHLNLDEPTDMHVTVIMHHAILTQEELRTIP